MKTARINLIDIKKKHIGHMTWTSDGKLDVSLEDAFRYFLRNFTNLLSDIEKQNGLPVIKSVEQDGKRLEIRETVALTDDGFPHALVDLINKSKFQSPRVFAVIDSADKKGGE